MWEEASVSGEEKEKISAPFERAARPSPALKAEILVTSTVGYFSLIAVLMENINLVNAASKDSIC